MPSKHADEAQKRTAAEAWVALRGTLFLAAPATQHRIVLVQLVTRLGCVIGHARAVDLGCEQAEEGRSD